MAMLVMDMTLSHNHIVQVRSVRKHTAVKKKKSEIPNVCDRRRNVCIKPRPTHELGSR